MTSPLPFQQVDVFTAVPFKGNPVAVVLEADGLSTSEMQRIAHWTNLSETTFVCTPDHPDADYKLRIFTPNSELPFAGHPTLGSAHAVLQHGINPKTPGRLVQECRIGLVDIRIDHDEIFFTLPEAEIKEVDSQMMISLMDALDINADDVKYSRVIDIGAVWVTLQLPSDEIVGKLIPDMQKLSAIIPDGITGVTVFGETDPNSRTQFEVRSFAPNEGVPEDPVCGSGNGCVANMVKLFNLINEDRYTASQGSRVKRDGYIEVRFKEDGRIELGGHAVTCVNGTLNS